MKINQIEFIKSVFNPSGFPKQILKEIVFAGKSNVGKSSVINLLCGKKTAKSSKTPGRTQSVNYFLINNKFYFTDLPGYGYSKIPKSVSKNWDELMRYYFEEYLSEKLVISIMDARHAPTKLDKGFIDYLTLHKIPFIIILNKSDRLSNNQKHNSLSVYVKELKLPEKDAFIFFSAKTGEGKEFLFKKIRKFL